MSAIHRNNDLRSCGAQTIASQTTVTISGEAIAVVGDVNTHGNGQFLSNNRKVSIGGKNIIGVGDHAAPDNQSHPIGATDAATGSDSVSIG